MQISQLSPDSYREVNLNSDDGQILIQSSFSDVVAGKEVVTVFNEKLHSSSGKI